MTTYRKLCHENHTGPAEMTYPENKIGAPWVGYGVFTLFLDDGAYGEDQTVIDAINDLNEDFRDTYDQLQAEADGIYEWVKTTFTIGQGQTYETMEAFNTAAEAKAERRLEIDAEIEEAWRDSANIARALISDDAYDDFLEAHPD